MILALTALVAASCASVPTPNTSPLVGRWTSSQGRQTAECTFANDGTFTGRVRAGDAVVSDFTGKWSLRGQTIAYEYTSDRLGRIPAGTRDQDMLLSINKSQYVIRAADGSTRTYLRALN